MAAANGMRRQFSPKRTTKAWSSDTKSPGPPLSPKFSSESKSWKDMNKPSVLAVRDCVMPHSETGDAAPCRHVLRTEMVAFQLLVEAQLSIEEGDPPVT